MDAFHFNYIQVCYHKIGLWAVSVSCLLNVHSLFAQMQIEFRLPEASRTDTILIDIEEILVDSTVLLQSYKLNSYPPVIEVGLEPESCSSGTPLNYVVQSGEWSFSGSFMGSCDRIKIDVDGGRIYYPAGHPLYQLYVWNNRGSDDPLVLDSMDREIFRLRKEGVFPLYVDYLLYNGVVQGFYKYDTLNAFLGLDSMDSYWIQAMREKLSVKSSGITAIERKLDTLLRTEEVVLLKFWGEWCVPCVRDNETIAGILKFKEDFPYILGVQNDRATTMETEYDNVMDPDGFIARHYRLNAYPLYILFSANGEEFRTNKLAEMRAFISAR